MSSKPFPPQNPAPENPVRSVCVFCASSDNVPEIYKTAAADLGRLCAQEGWQVVYGGAHSGLMGLLADNALAAGGEVVGVIPEFLKNRERAHSGVSRLYTTKDMHERQQKMAELSDAFVVLPGGLGTLAEFFEVLTWKQVGLHDKPIALMDIGGHWGPLEQMIGQVAAQGFMYQNPENLYTILKTVEEVKNFLHTKA